jgi:hypothetical protein
MIDAQTSPVCRVEVIAPSPDVSIIVEGKAFTAPTAAQAHTPPGCGGADRFLGGVLLRHQFAPQQFAELNCSMRVERAMGRFG